MIRRCSLTLCCLVALGGCSYTGVGNPAPVPMSLGLAIVDDPKDQDLDQDLPQASIQDAIVVLGELRFQPCDPALSDVRVVPGPFVVDFKKHTTTPSIPDISGVSSGFCGIDAPLAPGNTAALAGRSLFFDGFRGDGTFFIVYANMHGVLKLRATAGQSWLGQDPPSKFFWALRPRRWLAKSELNSADITPGDSQQAVVIDANRHPALFLAIRSRLAGLSKLYADVDGDGEFTDVDRDAVVGEGLENAD